MHDNDMVSLGFAFLLQNKYLDDLLEEIKFKISFYTYA